MSMRVLTFSIATFLVSLFAGCSQSDSASVPPALKVENVETAGTGSLPPQPDWITQRKFEKIDVTDHDRRDILNMGIDLYSQKNFEEAYPYLLAAAESDQKVAHLYLGLIMTRPGELFYQRGALSHYYYSLDSGAHASSLLAIARALTTGTDIDVDIAGAAQYYARLGNLFGSDHALSMESRKFFDEISTLNIAEAERRELEYLNANDQNPQGSLSELVALTTELSGSSKAPYTEYLSIK